MKTCGTCAESKNHECRNVFCIEDDDVNRLPDKQPHDSSPR